MAQSPNYPAPQQQQNYPPPQNYPQAQQGQQYPMQAPPPPQQGGNYRVPAQVSVPAGTYITVRVNQQLSSDHNQPGDAFSATLVRPLVANGVVLAEPGQTIGGRVAQAQKAGRVEGLSKLGIELTDLTLVDDRICRLRRCWLAERATAQSAGMWLALLRRLAWGQRLVRQRVGDGARRLVLESGRGSRPNWSVGDGAGQPSIIYPEQVFTFRIEQPFTVSTERSPQAFRYVQPGEYSQPAGGPGPGYGAPTMCMRAPLHIMATLRIRITVTQTTIPMPGSRCSVGPGWGRGYYYGGRYAGGFGYRGFRR